MKRSAVIESIIERDGGLCQDCGKPFDDVHHITGRWHKLAWDIRNLICLCRDCHELRDKQAGAHTTEGRRRHIALLADKYGYDYPEECWRAWT